MRMVERRKDKGSIAQTHGKIESGRPHATKHAHLAADESCSINRYCICLTTQPYAAIHR
jgi:hypothetical protein